MLDQLLSISSSFMLALFTTSSDSILPFAFIMHLNILTIAVGAVYLHMTHILVRHTSQVVSQSQKAKEDVTLDVPSNPGLQAVTVLVHALQTLVIMGVMNLCDVDNYVHAVQLGVFFFFGFYGPAIFQGWAWQNRTCDVLRNEVACGVLNSVGLTCLLHYLGTAIV